MVIGSHNSWSFNKAAKWWLRWLAYIGRCQRVSIRKQYVEYGVRCFDLRIRFTEDRKLQVAHGVYVFDITEEELESDLTWLNDKGDCFVRVMNEVRTRKRHTWLSTKWFAQWCKEAVVKWPQISFFGGRCIMDWVVDYRFDGVEPVCVECHASVCRPKWVDDWWPWLFAARRNREILAAEYAGDVLLIDFVDIGREKGGVTV